MCDRGTVHWLIYISHISIPALSFEWKMNRSEVNSKRIGNVQSTRLSGLPIFYCLFFHKWKKINKEKDWKPKPQFFYNSYFSLSVFIIDFTSGRGSISVRVYSWYIFTCRAVIDAQYESNRSFYWHINAGEQFLNISFSKTIAFMLDCTHTRACSGRSDLLSIKCK